MSLKAGNLSSKCHRIIFTEDSCPLGAIQILYVYVGHTLVASIAFEQIQDGMPSTRQPGLTQSSCLTSIPAAGPIVYKTASAALHLYASSAQDTAVTQNFVNITLTNGTGTLLAASSNNSIVLAFNVSLASVHLAVIIHVSPLYAPHFLPMCLEPDQ